MKLAMRVGFFFIFLLNSGMYSRGQNSTFESAAAIGTGAALGGFAAGAGIELAKHFVKSPVSSLLYVKIGRWLSRDRGESAAYVANKIRDLQNDMNKKAKELDQIKGGFLTFIRKSIPMVKKTDARLSALEAQYNIQPFNVDDNI